MILSKRNSSRLFKKCGVCYRPLRRASFGGVPVPLHHFLKTFTRHYLPHNVGKENFLVHRKGALRRECFTGTAGVFARHRTGHVLGGKYGPKVRGIAGPLCTHIGKGSPMAGVRCMSLRL